MSHIESRTERARRLRRDRTRAEVRLRNRHLEGFKFRRQVPIGLYFADFACLEAKLVIELDGGQHAEAAAYDAARTQVIENAGFRVLRFWNRHVLGEPEGVLHAIAAELQSAKPRPLTFPLLCNGPLPLPMGEET